MANLLTTHAPARTTDAAAAARAALRDQVARLERELATYPVAGDHDRPRCARMLGLAELERVRDDLAGRLAEARRALTERGLEQERARARLERMLLAPGEHKFERVAAAELGEGGCGVYQVRPRLGLIGMLAGWWHVKLSSGCPLAT